MFGRNSDVANSKRAKLLPPEDVLEDIDTLDDYDDDEPADLFPDPHIDPDVGASLPKRYFKKKPMVPMALATVVACIGLTAGAYFCVTNAMANIAANRAATDAAIQEQVDAVQAAKDKEQQELEDAIAKREKEAEAANKKFGDKVIELRPEQTREELAEAQAAEAVPVGVDTEAISPETDGRAMWVVLEEGDTLGALADYFNIDLPTLLELNGIDDSTQLYAGDMIRVG